MSGLRLGIDALLAAPSRYLGKARRVALLANQASLTSGLRSTLAAMRDHPDIDVVALLTPEHGWSGFEEDAHPVPDAQNPTVGLAIHSLYGPRRRPHLDLLRGVEAVVIDLHDVGVRCYTYAATTALLLEAAAVSGTRVVICDRPNPLGRRVAGPPLDPKLRSFLAYLDLPYQHGLTLGEIARWVADQGLAGAVDLVVATLEGWEGEQATATPFIPPSPGLASPAALQGYPGTVLLEGFNLSEGRGTTLPFQLIGAPYLDSYRLARELQSLHLPGIAFRPLDFKPLSDTFTGERCGGVQLLLTDPEAFSPLPSLISMLRMLSAQTPELRLIDSNERPWAAEATASLATGDSVAMEPAAGPLIDALTGSDEVRAAIAGALTIASLHERWAPAWAAHAERMEGSMLYEPPLRFSPGRSSTIGATSSKHRPLTL